jgi:hypothetical protein
MPGEFLRPFRAFAFQVNEPRPNRAAIGAADWENRITSRRRGDRIGEVGAVPAC